MEIPELSWEYRGDGLYIYWHNPFDGGKKQDVLMFMWPIHAVEDTAKVEAAYEAMAELFCKSASLREENARLREEKVRLALELGRLQTKSMTDKEATLGDGSERNIRLDAKRA